jgi:hypothetical protein
MDEVAGICSSTANGGATRGRADRAPHRALALSRDRSTIGASIWSGHGTYDASNKEEEQAPPPGSTQPGEANAIRSQ